MKRLEGAVAGFGFSTIEVMRKACPTVSPTPTMPYWSVRAGIAFLDGEQVAAGLVVGGDHLRQAAGLGGHQHVGKEHRERLVADELARAPHRMAESERLLLAGEAHRAGRGRSRRRRSSSLSFSAPLPRSACSSSTCMSK